MSIEEITRMQQLEDLKYSAAKAIRQMLDAYAEKHAELGGEDWESVETEISELVFGE